MLYKPFHVTDQHTAKFLLQSTTFKWQTVKKYVICFILSILLILSQTKFVKLPQFSQKHCYPLTGDIRTKKETYWLRNAKRYRMTTITALGSVDNIDCK